MPQNTNMKDVNKAVKMNKAQKGKYLVFDLANEVYGLEILKVQEIIGMIDITRVPRMPDFVRGVINLRGKIIPVMDLRLKFNLDMKEYTERTCIIVVKIEKEDSQVTTGVIVDEVSEVEDIKDDQIEPSPDFGANVNTDFILGVGKSKNRVVMLLDIEKILTDEDVINLRQATVNRSGEKNKEGKEC
jgi:purine-binding chemotaxis protein CheW